MTQRPFDPERSIYHEANTQDVVNMLLENVMGENNGEYPENDEVDGLAPSLKGLIMREIDASTLRSCKHMEHDVKSMAADIQELLPAEEVAALRKAMGIPEETQADE